MSLRLLLLSLLAHDPDANARAALALAVPPARKAAPYPVEPCAAGCPCDRCLIRGARVCVCALYEPPRPCGHPGCRCVPAVVLPPIRRHYMHPMRYELFDR